DFVERLPARARFGVRAIDALAGKRLNDREHPAIAQIAVVSKRKQLSTRFLLGSRHPFPKIARVVAAERLLCGERLDEARLRAVVAPDNVAMQIVAAGVRRPFEADEGGEPSRIVRLICRLDRL